VSTKSIPDLDDESEAVSVSVFVSASFLVSVYVFVSSSAAVISFFLVDHFYAFFGTAFVVACIASVLVYPVGLVVVDQSYSYCLLSLSLKTFSLD